MTDAANPERLLFASTTQSFLEKEALTGSAARTARGRVLPSKPTGGGAPPNSAGRACWCPRNSAAAACRAMAWQTSPWSPSWPVRRSPQDRCIRSAPCSPGWSRRPKTTRTQSNRWFRVRSSRSWAVYEPGKPWAPLDAAVTATPTESGFRIDGVKDRVEAGAESAVLLVVARSEGAVRQFLVPTDAPGVRVEPQRSIDMVKTLCPRAFRWRRGRRLRGRRLGRADLGHDRAPEPDRNDPSVRRDRGHPGNRAGLHHSVGIRPALVRPPAGVLSGAQTQVRRPEDLVRGVPRDDELRGGGGGFAVPRRRDGGQRREIVCG